MLYTNTCESPLGRILLAGDEQALTGLWFAEGGRTTGLGLKKDACPRETDYFDRAKEWLAVYFSGRDPGFLPPIHLTGSDFRRRVGELLCEIPYGETVTYGALAERLAGERALARVSAQAVGGAVGHNPIGIIVPCHRVVGAKGSLTGYAGGLLRKRALLELEGNDLSRFTSPSGFPLE